MPIQTTAPQVWSVAGTDSSGGAGLSADQRAATALGVHLCPVVAAVTAQNSQAVTHIHAVPAQVVAGQLQALADDLPAEPTHVVLKTGLLGSVENVQAVADCVHQLRDGGRRVSLVIDPVLCASTGTDFANAEIVRAYVSTLLPLATLVTPNAQEAQVLCHAKNGETAGKNTVVDSPIELVQQLNAMGAEAVCVTGGDSVGSGDAIHASDAWATDWMHTTHASGWLRLPRHATPHTHGTGCTFATAAAAALALGFVSADALVLAKMATAHAIAQAKVLGQGNGSVYASADFHQPQYVPQLSWGETTAADAASDRTSDIETQSNTNSDFKLPAGLYTLASTPEQLGAQLKAGARVVQLRMKATDAPDWHEQIAHAVRRSVELAQQHGATLFINDHWQLAIEHGAAGIHLGQEDVQGMSVSQREQLRAYQAQGGLLGISSHSLWELARAKELNPAYIACGPVWATTTKDMPWRPQGLHNLGYWAHMAGKPVVAIGGVLDAQQVHDCAAAGAHHVCAVRAVAQQPDTVIPAFQQSYLDGMAGRGQVNEAANSVMPRSSLTAD